jgi:hypothetical protein
MFDELLGQKGWVYKQSSKPFKLQIVVGIQLEVLGNHSKAAIDYHFKTGHREAA